VPEMPALTIGTKTARLPIIQGGMAVRISMAPLAACSGPGRWHRTDRRLGTGARRRCAPRCGPPTRHRRRGRRRQHHGGHSQVQGDRARGARRRCGSHRVRCRVLERCLPVGPPRRACPVVPIVGSARVASLSERFGAAAVVVEGVEAGGHLGTDRPCSTCFPRSSMRSTSRSSEPAGWSPDRTSSARSTPVQPASRWDRASRQRSSPRHPRTSSRCTSTQREDDIVLVKSPVGLPGRAIRNPFSRRWPRGSCRRSGAASPA
jgi:nitronate monooxygenase